MKNKIYTFTTLVVAFCLNGLCTPLYAQNVELEWVNPIGGSCGIADEDDVTTAVAVDAAGNVYATGWFCGSLDIDPSDSTYILNDSDGKMFVSKYDAAGNFIWAKQFKEDHSPYIGFIHMATYGGILLSVDEGGNVFLSGSFWGTVDLDPGAGTDTFSGNNGAFVIKLDTDGNYVWAKTLSGSSTSNSYPVTPSGITTQDGHIYLTGSFSGPTGADTFDFDPGTGVANLITGGGADIFVLKLDTAGTFNWAKKMGGKQWDKPMAIAVDTAGNILTTGTFQDTADFDPGIANAPLVATGYAAFSGGLEDVFIAKLDAAGNFVWAKALLIDGTVSPYHRIQSFSIATDAAGNVYTSGMFTGSADFNPGQGTFNITTGLNNDFHTFICKLNVSGGFAWAKAVPNFGYELAFLATDGEGNVIYTTPFAGTVDFDLSGQGTANLTSVNSTPDIAISKLTTNGDFVWAKALGGDAVDKCYDLTTDPSGHNIYSAGSFAGFGGGWTDFDPSEDTLKLFSPGGSDGFLHKMTCNSFSTLTEVVCDSFMLGSQVYTESGSYLQTLPNSNGCDSIIRLDLTVNKSLDTLTETACQSYNLNGETYTSGGYHIQTYTNLSGCDSIIVLHLTLNTLDTGVQIDGATLTAAATGVSYQWVDCAIDYEEIPGATEQRYTPPAAGSYAVVITENDCSDTSACYTVDPLSIGDTDLSQSVRLYPNPGHNYVTIHTDKTTRPASWRILNAVGQTVKKQTALKGNTFVLDIRELSAGMYIIELTDGMAVARVKFIKQ